MASLSLLEELHLQQIGQLMFRAGIELSLPNYPEQTNYIRKLWESNCTFAHLDSVWRMGALGGSVAIYCFPADPEGYTLRFFSIDNFKNVEFSDTGEIASINLYWQEGNNWIELKIDKEKFVTLSNRNPPKITQNNYGFVPVILISNKSSLPCYLGEAEFERLEDEIEAFCQSTNEIRNNVNLFSGALFYSSRTKSELIEAGICTNNRDGWGSNSKTKPLRLRAILDNYDPNEDTAGFLSPEAIQPQTLNYIREWRSQIRSALGSVDESRLYNETLLIRSPAELQLALSFAIDTARKRAYNYLDKGVVKAYEVILKMAQTDKKIAPFEGKLKWRYLGNIWKETSREELERSIVARNMGRLGISPLATLKWLFPDRTEEELLEAKKGGFAYEFISGIAEVASKLGKDGDFLTNYLKEELNGERE